MSVAAWTETARQWIRLPICDRGCGLREAMDRRHAQFVGGMAQIIPHLVSRRTCNVVVEGRMNIEAVVDLFGNGTFDGPSVDP